MSAITLKLKGQSVELTDWQPIDRGAEISPTNWVRRLASSNDKFSCVGWMVSWRDGIVNGKHHWAPMFLGPVLYELCDMYYRFYPSPKPYIDNSMYGTFKYYPSLSPPQIVFQDHQLEEAKQHMDQFIRRVNKMASFL